MLNRFFVLVLLVYVAVFSAAYGQQVTNQGLSYLIQEPTANSTGSSFIGYLDNTNPLTSIFTTNGPVGLSKILVKPDGSKFYLIAPGVIESIDGAFSTAPRIINGLPGPANSAAITPDGKYLLVGTTDNLGNSALFLIDTNTDLIVGNGGVALPSATAFGPGSATTFCPQCFIAVSRDSTTAWVLTNSGSSGRLTAINLNTRLPIAQLVLSGGATSVTLSPLNLLYVTAVNRIYEIDPTTLTVTPTGTISLFFSPYQLHFTTDGQSAYCINVFPNSGGSILKLSVATHATVQWPAPQSGVTALPIDDIVLLSNSRLLAYYTSGAPATAGALYDIDPNTLVATPSTLSIGPANTQFNIIAVAASNELPAAKFLFMVINNGNQTNLYRMDLSTNTVSVENPLVTPLAGAQVVTVPPQTGTANFFVFNNNQILNTGGQAATMYVRLLDVNGLPVYNQAVTFTPDPTTGATISSASAVSNGDGWVQVNVTVPNVGANYNITLTAGAVTATLTVTVPGGTSGSTGTGSGGQVNIISGQGQIIVQNNANTIPMIIQVVDTTGKPAPNVAITFSLTNGNGGILPTTTTTDTNGLAQTSFTAFAVPVNTTVLQNIIHADAGSLGGVDFTETTLPIDLANGQGIPQINFIHPTIDSNFTVTLPAGTAVPDAIEMRIQMQLFPFPQPSPTFQNPPLFPGIGIFLYNPLSTPDNPLPPPANCQGAPLSGQDGIVHCTVVAGCQLGSQPLGVYVGTTQLPTNPLQLIVTQGGPTIFNVLGGNNQSGVAGTTLSGLTVSLTDGCGNAVANAKVVWAVKSGNATIVTPGTLLTNGNGTTSNGVKLGSSPGVVTVTVTSVDNPAVSQTFTLTNSIVISTVTPVSGSGQTGKVGQPFPNPLIVQVKDVNGKGLPGVPVTFTVNTGTASLNPTTTSTDTNGNAQTIVTAGTAAGPIVVTATVGQFNVTFGLTSQLPGPAITSTSFANAASGVVGLVPCGLATVTGTGVATGISGIVSGISPFGLGPLPFVLSGFSLTVNGVAAPIQALANQNGVQYAVFQTPCEISSPGSANVVVSLNGSSTTVTNVPVFAAQPGIFTYQAANGKFYADVIRALDGSFVEPGSFAHRGETYYMLVTGLNQASPTIRTDDIGIAGQNVVFPTIVSVNNSGVPVVSSQYWTGGEGVYIVGFTVPLTAPTGPDQNLAIGVTANGQLVVGPIVQFAGVQ